MKAASHRIKCLAAMAILVLGAPASANESLVAEIDQQRALLGAESTKAAARQRLAEIGWALAEAMENAEAVERHGDAAHIARAIKQKLPDIVWRTQHYADHKNDPQAQLAAATLHRTGTLLEHDPVKACDYYRKVSSSENAIALWRLSACVAPSDRPAARALLERAAVAGHAEAQQMLAEVWLTNREEERRKMAVELLKLSAAQGRRSSVLLLAALFETGTVVEKNIDKAAELYRNIAEQGNAVGQNNLGALYQRQGKIDDAAEWYRKAADQNLPVAQLNYGLLHTRGEAPWNDGCMAKDWIGRAADNGLELAGKILKSPAEYNIRCE